MKLLFLVAAIAVAWWALRLLRRPHPVSAERPRDHEPRVENMVSCARCGLHVPESEAVHRDGRHYCSEAHARGDRH